MEKQDTRVQKIRELLDTGKSKGTLTYKEIMDSLEELDLDQEQVEKIYEHLEEMNIDVVEDVEVPEDINEEIAEIENTRAAVFCARAVHCMRAISLCRRLMMRFSRREI